MIEATNEKKLFMQVTNEKKELNQKPKNLENKHVNQKLKNPRKPKAFDQLKTDVKIINF